MKKILVLFLIFLCSLQAKIVYLTLPDGSYGDLRYWTTTDGVRDGTTLPFYYLREALENRGYEIRYLMDDFSIEKSDADQIAAILSFGETRLEFLLEILRTDHLREKSLLFVMEPPINVPFFYDPVLLKFFRKVFVMPDEWLNGKIDGKQFCKWFFPQPYMQIIVDIPKFSDKKFCTMIAGNKNVYDPLYVYKSLYPERRKIIRFFEKNHPQEFDLYGTAWSGWSSNKGPVASKFDTLKNYKFSICYENMGDQNGYITEKIFDCLMSGCVPVYLGADDIADFVPSNCFIDRRNFSSDEELYCFLKTIDEGTYNQYIDSIKKYFQSPQSRFFSIDYFIELVLDNIETQADSL